MAAAALVEQVKVEAEVETEAMGELSSGFLAVGLGSLGSGHQEVGDLQAPEIPEEPERAAEGWVASCPRGSLII